ncbi:MAG: hypothetical protein K2J79_07815, partial [Ruminiclostridium sp.]|nr:hypothetical protein [Ruminiclostridium sp.]
MLKLDRFFGSNSVVSIALSLILSVFLSKQLKAFLHSAVDYSYNSILETVCLSLLIFLMLTLFFGIFLYYGALDKLNLKGLGKMALGGGAMLFILFIFIPCDSYINNFSDFNFPLTAFIFILLGRFFLYLLPFAYLGAVLKEKQLSVIFNILCGLTLCFYAQFMFMNQNLGLVIGDEVKWEEHLDYGLITLAVWLVLLALPFILSKLLKKRWKKFSLAVPGLIGAMQVINLILLLITTEKDIFSYQNVLLDGSEQYTVSSKKNIVTFVFDAADNTYFNKLLENRPEVFEGLEDFTLYTNTCSVHDYTLASISQMLTGTTKCPMYNTADWLNESWKSQKAEDFYSRLHNAGYTVNGYMYSEAPAHLLEGKFDNSNPELRAKSADKEAIAESIMKIAKYRYMPYLLKRFYDIQGVDFKAFVKNPAEYYYNDSDYMDNLKLNKSNSQKNYFIFEHLFGPHPPCDDVIEETVNCLNIVKEYIRQLKEMDLYDDAFIIITADHGRHTSNFTEAAATPIYMVKEAGKTHEKMEITNAPQYHADFLATYLYAAGLYTESDREIYGNTVFDYKEDEERERIWYDHTSDDSKPNPNNASCNVYYAYKYTGDD